MPFSMVNVIRVKTATLFSIVHTCVTFQEDLLLKKLLDDPLNLLAGGIISSNI